MESYKLTKQWFNKYGPLAVLKNLLILFFLNTGFYLISIYKNLYLNGKMDYFNYAFILFNIYIISGIVSNIVHFFVTRKHFLSYELTINDNFLSQKLFNTITNVAYQDIESINVQDNMIAIQSNGEMLISIPEEIDNYSEIRNRLESILSTKFVDYAEMARKKHISLFIQATLIKIVWGLIIIYFAYAILVDSIIKVHRSIGFIVGIFAQRRLTKVHYVRNSSGENIIDGNYVKTQ